MKIKKFNDNIKNLIKDLNDDEDQNIKIDNDFEKFEIIKNQLISKLNSEKLIGNTLSDLGNFIGQTIYQYMDDDLFSEDDFISGFKHDVDTMKEPSKSKYHNFK
jgi:hypothetical protein